jgi:hypothetical protein
VRPKYGNAKVSFISQDKTFIELVTVTGYRLTASNDNPNIQLNDNVRIELKYLRLSADYIVSNITKRAA